MPKRVVLIRHGASRHNGFIGVPDRLSGGI
jgi:broad specificity phosphatase PhoE